MSLSFQEKEKVVMFVSEEARSAETSFLLNPAGITANEMNELRKKARSSRVTLRVAKNSLAERALKGTPFSCFDETLLKGQTLMVFRKGDPGELARLIDAFMKDHPKLVVKAISIQGKLLKPSELKAVSKLPTYKESLVLLMNVLKAPLVQYIRTLKEPYAKCVRVLSAIGQKK